MPTRALTSRQAITCETARTKRCRCRCGGLLHGKGRFGTADEAAQLPGDDEHHADPPGERDRERALRRELRAAAALIQVDQPALWDLEGHEI